MKHQINQQGYSLDELLQEASVSNESTILINSVVIADEVKATSQYPAPKMSEEFYLPSAN